MKKISETLLRYKNITPPDDYLRVFIIEYIKKNLDIIIEKKDVKIRGNIAYIKTNPSYKGEIFIKKTSILNQIKNIGDKKIIDIR